MRLYAEKGSPDVTVSELAEFAGVARGTIYNNIDSKEGLFAQVAEGLTTEMNRRVSASYVGIEDPAKRLAIGIRLYLRRAHEEPHWGRFVAQFALHPDIFRSLWSGPVVRDVLLGVDSGRYDVPRESIASAVSIIAGSTLAAIVLVLDGIRTWREAGAEVAERVLRALGVTAEEARALASGELPLLADGS